MYGVFIVKPADGSNTTWDGGYAYDQDRLFTMSEMDPVWHEDSVLEHPHDTIQVIHEVSIPEYHPTYFLVNGQSEHQLLEPNIALQTAKEQVTFLRMANIGYLSNRITFPQQLNAQIVSTDGRPIVPMEASDTLWISPGERYGVLIEPLVDLVDSISISYVNMNTHLSESIQYIPVNVSGTNSLVELNEDLGFQLYPNPSNGTVFVIAPEGTLYNGIKIYNALGQVVHVDRQIIHGNDDYQINASLSKGFYTIELLHNDRILASLKLVKN
jgi:hypothetical protein